MKLQLKRIHRTEKSTIGELTIDGKFECYVLEDIEREVKVYAKTAIPRGTYNVVITMSNRFKKELPLLENVPNFLGIRIHSGNKAEDTEGCLLLGQTRGINVVSGSRLAMNAFMPKLRNALSIGKVSITIT